MREIKFRGKRKDNGEWVYGWYMKHPFSNDPENPVDCIIEDSMPHEVIPETVGQFTGLIKKGKEVYGGDIFESSNKRWGPRVVNWKGCQFFAPLTHKYWSCGYNNIGLNNFHYDKNLKVIGNIHENGDLLDESE